MILEYAEPPFWAALLFLRLLFAIFASDEIACLWNIPKTVRPTKD